VHRTVLFRANCFLYSLFSVQPLRESLREGSLQPFKT
jgi:hypothetical protein